MTASQWRTFAGKGSDPEIALAWQMSAMKLPEPVREHRFHDTRKWRFDFAWPELWIAVEVDGGGYVGGRHVRGTGFESDLEKLNEAACAGWTVLRVTPTQVESGAALRWIEQLMGRKQR